MVERGVHGVEDGAVVHERVGARHEERHAGLVLYHIRVQHSQPVPLHQVRRVADAHIEGQPCLFEF